jgi:LDH2 family malate/lactate/ureidoglycolate dehydrogenase
VSATPHAKDYLMADYRIVKPDALEATGTAVFEALGAPHDIAAEVAGHLVRANLAGHDSHGAIRIPQYAGQIDAGVVHPAARPSIIGGRGATVLVDGARGFGQVATRFALVEAMSRARVHGIAGAAIRQANHIGRVGDYAEIAAAEGLVTILTVGSAGPGVGAATPFGGAARFLGTNPWSMGIPVGNDGAPPVLVDFATTVVAEGKVKVARAKHEALPFGCITDRHGAPSTDPEDFYAGGMLLPFGGHKGYGLALASALIGTLAIIDDAHPTMAGNLADARDGAELASRVAGAFLVVIDPSAFGDAEVYRERVARVTRELRKVPPAGTGAVMLPGDPESRTTASRRASGITLPDDTWDAIAAIAAAHGVEMPEYT